MYDVIVIGAGPAGAMAAAQAARNGVPTLLIEKRQEIGSPVRCAEGVGKEGLLKTGISIDRRWIANESRGARIIAPDTTTVELSSEHAGNEVGYVLERKMFDRHLVYEAARAGSDLMVKSSVIDVLRKGNRINGVVVSSMGKRIEIEGRVLIACDGAESQIARFAGINTKLKLKDMESCIQYLMVNVDYDPDFTRFYVGSCYSPGGYVWIFPKGDGVANVGIGVLGSKIGKKKGYAKELLDSFISRQEKLKNARIVEYVAGTVPAAMPLEKTWTDGLLIAGDAARFTDPITGGGIINAMMSGKMAGEVSSQNVKAGMKLSEYERKWKRELESALLRDYIVKERLVNMSDETLNLIADSLKDYEFPDLGMNSFIDAINEKHPELMKELIDLI